MSSRFFFPIIEQFTLLFSGNVLSQSLAEPSPDHQISFPFGAGELIVEHPLFQVCQWFVSSKLQHGPHRFDSGKAKLGWKFWFVKTCLISFFLYAICEDLFDFIHSCASTNKSAWIFAAAPGVRSGLVPKDSTCKRCGVRETQLSELMKSAQIRLFFFACRTPCDIYIIFNLTSWLVQFLSINSNIDSV